jgi:hypothetical protein
VGDDFDFVSRHSILKNPEYWFEIDEYVRGQDQLLLAHLRIAKWTPSVLKRIDRDWRVFRECVTAPLFAHAEIDDRKWERFVSRLGFRFLCNVVGTNGETRRMFISRINNARFRTADLADQHDAVEAAG